MSLHLLDNRWRRRLAARWLAAKGLAACGVAGLVWLPLVVHGQTAATTSAARGETARPSIASRSAAPATPPALSVTDPDSLDAIREWLAARLGSRKSVDPKAPHVVRIATRAPGEFQVSTAAVAAGRARGAGPGRAVAAGEAARASEEATASAWAYEGPSGPQAWAGLSPEYAACGNGRRQSPIDIRDAIRVDLEPIRFDYRASGFSVLDTGHTIQVRLDPGNTLEVMGRRYELRHLEFRHPGEERIEGRGFAMSVQLTHQDAEGRVAVLAVPLEPGEPGQTHPVVQAAWNNLPLERGEEVPARGTLEPQALLPEDRRYHVYMGSLTTPPCTEGVLWMVMEQPVRLAPEQIAIFARLYPMNARPVQAVAGRLIKGSN